MPGYYAHLASSNPRNRLNNSFIKGVIMPDLLKTYYKKYGFVKAKAKYNEMKNNDMPDFSFFEKRLKEKETDFSSDGMHFGKSATPNIHLFWDSLSEEQKINPFFRGYLWHLLTDYYTYQTLGLFSDIDVNLLHDDWDHLNSFIASTYPSVILPEEVKALKIVSFKDGNIYNYVNPTSIKEIIDYLCSFDILYGDVDSIIDEIESEVNKKKSTK